MDDKVMPRATGLDARFDAELAAEIPGWPGEFGGGGVRHNAAERRFEIATGERLAVAEYELAGGAMIFTHTFVPPELRGQKLAERLVSAAMKFARAEGLRVVPRCSYVEKFLARHEKEFGDLRA